MVVTKPAELRKEQKKYFNIAYQGEPVVVSRPRNENVVIMSEERYNDIMTKNRLLSYYCGLSNKTLENDDLISSNNSDNSELSDSNGVIVGIAKGIELCRPGYDIDVDDEEIAKMFGVI